MPEFNVLDRVRMRTYDLVSQINEGDEGTVQRVLGMDMPFVWVDVLFDRTGRLVRVGADHLKVLPKPMPWDASDDESEHDPASCGPCDDHADATVQADRDEHALDGAL